MSCDDNHGGRGAFAQEVSPADPLNDRQHIAIHEAGHAVIGRVLNIPCGDVTIIADHDSAGHSITSDRWEILEEWEKQGRFRDYRTVILGRIITMMAGAEAEAILLGECEGGDDDDRYWIGVMLDELPNGPPKEPRLRSMTRMLCRRHAERILALANILKIDGSMTDQQVRELLDLPIRPYDPHAIEMYAAYERDRQEKARNRYQARMDRAETAGVFTGFIVFLAAWAYCAVTYGFLFGFGLGWLPSGILGFMVGAVTRVSIEQ